MSATSRDRSLTSDAVASAVDPRRRRFLFALTASSAGAVAAAAAPGVTASVAPAAPASAARAGGYRLTEHIRDYYDSARL
jgi:Rieske Fe-S protein